MKGQIHIDQDEALYLLDTLLDKKEQEIDYFLVGKFLLAIQDNKFFQGDDFFRWISDKYGFESRKVNYITSFFKSAEMAGISFAQQKDNNVGWTKLTLLAPVIDQSNFNYWINLAKSMSAEKLKNEVKEKKKAQKAKAAQ
ncbi:MAG: hypothetical protein HQL95_03855 [Magnetococcales bacterium]|nr:hypothetical protein [Magnetococcales bacterium]